MRWFLLMFYQSRDALKMVDVLKENGIEGVLMPTPEVINPDCGFSVRVSEEQVKDAMRICQKEQCEPHEIYLMKQMGLKWIIEDDWENE